MVVFSLAPHLLQSIPVPIHSAVMPFMNAEVNPLMSAWSAPGPVLFCRKGRRSETLSVGMYSEQEQSIALGRHDAESASM
jgi:hypothetical protein